MRHVEWSQVALAQYHSAIDYLAERNADAAQDVADRIRDTINALARRPIGRPGERSGTYEKTVLRTSYIIIYSLVGGANDSLRVLRVYHTAQNWTDWSPMPDEEV